MTKNKRVVYLYEEVILPSYIKIITILQIYLYISIYIYIH